MNSAEDSERSRLSDVTLDLVSRAQSGDKEALDSLFRRYLPRVRLIAGLKLGWSTGRLGEIDDIVQESLLKAMTSLDQFKTGEFRRWMNCIVGCVINDMADKVHAQKRDPSRERSLDDFGDESLSTFILAGDCPTPSAVLRGKELEERIEKALLRLPEAQREIIILRQLYGYSYAEVAAELGFAKEASVRVALSRALEKLKEFLGD